MDYMDDSYNNTTNIKVIGVGGGGGNAINRMIEDGVKGVEFIAMNTDNQVLSISLAPTKVQLGVKLTKGRGAGANPEIGKRSAEESTDDIVSALTGAQMVFITAGMGGGTGTGAAPVVAKLAKEMGILTVGIVTRPFLFEGKRKANMAEKGIDNLLEYVDSLIIVPNEKLKFYSNEKITMKNAFAIADNVLKDGVLNISSLINIPSFINLDFSDVQSVMSNKGYAHMGIGHGTGKNKAEDAAKQAVSSPLLETSIDGASGIVINICASPDIELDEIEKAATYITESANPDAMIIWGCSFDENLKDSITISLIATGFAGKKEEQKNTAKEHVYATRNVPNSSFVTNPTPTTNYGDYNDKEFEDVLALLRNHKI